MRKLLSVMLVALLLMLAVASPLAAQEETPTIADMITAMATDPSEPEFTLLYAALQAADPAVMENLAKPWNFTVFLPNDAAFEAFMEDTATETGMSAGELLAETSLLSDMLRYHFIVGQYTAENLMAQPMAFYGTHLPDNPLLITTEGETVMLNGYASVIESDIQAGNGMIHVIDNVLISPFMFMGAEVTMEATAEPETAAPAELMTIFDTAAGREDLNMMAAALEAGVLKDTLSKAIPYTVFVPTNAALEAFLSSMNVTAEDLMGNPDTLVPVLNYHMLSGKLTPDALGAAIALGETDGGAVFATQLPGTVATISMDGETLMINGIAVVEVIFATNGVIYVIDGVLLPQ